MNRPSQLYATDTSIPTLGTSTLNVSAVSWSAIVAGAAGAAALSLILLILGAGLGLSSVSPWTHNGMSAATFGVSTILWVTFTQLAASGMGGYLAGRLRTRWVNVHADEVYFRDTAHGFLAWAIASLATAALLTSAISSIVGGGIQAAGAITNSAVTTAATTAAADMTKRDSALDSNSGPVGYFMDSLFRKGTSTPSSVTATQSSAPPTLEVTRIFMNTKGTEPLPAEDVRYAGQLVAQHTGLTQQEAEQRVTDTYARMQAKLSELEAAAKEATDKGRKASAYAALWLFISLLVGAFFASLAATYGGHRRDL